MFAWWAELAVTRQTPGDTDFLLVQSPDAVVVGHALGWWTRHLHTLLVTTEAGATPAEVLAKVAAARQDVCPLDPYLSPYLGQAVVAWEPLWIPTDNVARLQYVREKAEERWARHQRAVQTAVQWEARALQP